MFTEFNDRLIVMDDLYNRFTEAEIKQLAGIGVKVLFPQGGVRWWDFQPDPEKPFNFNWLDRYINYAWDNGLKVLMPFVHSLPDWFPDNYYYTRETRGSSHNIFDYTLPETGGVIDNLAYTMIDRYGGPYFQLIYGYPADGEFPTHFWPTSPDVYCPHEALVEWIIGRQKALETQHNEVWTAFHPYMGPRWWNTYYASQMAAFPNSRHYQIIYTYFPHEHSAPHVKQYVGNLLCNGVNTFVGSEYCGGLRTNMETLKARLLTGFLTSPIHFSQGYPRLDAERLETIAWALDQLENYYN